MNFLKQSSEEAVVFQDAINVPSIEALKALLTTLASRDAYTAGHCVRVSRMARIIGRYMRLDPPQLWTLETAALFHDIGKIGTPDAILNKRDRLSQLEWREILRHPEEGVRILQPISLLNRCLQVMLHHHERYDGKGYPHGLRGDMMGLETHIMIVVDALDAMTSDRPYRNALPLREVYGRLSLGKGVQFDPRVLNVLFTPDCWEAIEKCLAKYIPATETADLTIDQVEKHPFWASISPPKRGQNGGLFSFHGFRWLNQLVSGLLEVFDSGEQESMAPPPELKTTIAEVTPSRERIELVRRLEEDDPLSIHVREVEEELERAELIAQRYEGKMPNSLTVLKFELERLLASASLVLEDADRLEGLQEIHLRLTQLTQKVEQAIAEVAPPAAEEPFPPSVKPKPRRRRMPEPSTSSPLSKVPT